MERQLNLMFEANSVFTPSAPIDNQSLFAGRKPQLAKVINAVAQRGQHAVIYGERGVGKTSLVNVLYDILKQGSEDISIARINCDNSLTFSSLWHGLFRMLSVKHQTTKPGFTSEIINNDIPADAYLPTNVKPDDVRYMFEQLNKKTIVIIDELDRIVDKDTTARLADTIKTLSDNSVNTTLILVGVGDSVDDLILEHTSIERALVQILMPRMSRDEISEIIDKGLGKLNMTIDEDARADIARLSEGLPHYTHLLSLHATQIATLNDRGHILLSDVKDALGLALDQAQQTIVRGYHTATSSPRGNLYAQVLLACAMAPVDDLGYFSSKDVRGPMSRIMGKAYEIPAFSRHLNDFTEKERGPVLQRTGYPRRYKFRFINPLMEPYVIMKGLKNELITDDDLRAIQSEEHS